MGFWFFDQLERNRLKAIARREERDRRNLSYQQYIGQNAAGKAIVKGANGESQVNYNAESQLRPGEMGRGGAISIRGQRTRRIPNRIFSTANGFPFKAIFGTKIGGDRAAREMGFSSGFTVMTSLGRGAGDWIAIQAGGGTATAKGKSNWSIPYPNTANGTVVGNWLFSSILSPEVQYSTNPTPTTTVTGTPAGQVLQRWRWTQLYRPNAISTGQADWPYSFARDTEPNRANTINRVTRKDGAFRFRLPGNQPIPAYYDFAEIENFSETTEIRNYVGAPANNGGMPADLAQFCSDTQNEQNMGNSILTIPGFEQRDRFEEKFSVQFKVNRAAIFNGNDLSASVLKAWTRHRIRAAEYSVAPGNITLAATCSAFADNSYRILINGVITTPTAIVQSESFLETESKSASGEFEVFPGAAVPFSESYSDTTTLIKSQSPPYIASQVLQDNETQTVNSARVIPILSGTQTLLAWDSTGGITRGIYRENTEITTQNNVIVRNYSVVEDRSPGLVNGATFPIPNFVSVSGGAVTNLGQTTNFTTQISNTAKYWFLDGENDRVEIPQRGTFGFYSISSTPPQIGATITLAPNAPYALEGRSLIQTTTTSPPSNTINTYNTPASWAQIDGTFVHLSQSIDSKTWIVWTGVITGSSQSITGTAPNDGRQLNSITVEITGFFETKVPLSRNQTALGNTSQWWVQSTHSINDLINIKNAYANTAGIRVRQPISPDELIEIWLSAPLEKTDTIGYANRVFLKSDFTIDCDRVGLSGKFVQFENRECEQVQYNA